jgi:preprotein translocase subunit SecE
MANIVQYCKDAYHELVNKVTWPTWPELQSTTMVVLGSILVVTLIVFVLDQSSSFVLTQYYQFFKTK